MARREAKRKAEVRTWVGVVTPSIFAGQVFAVRETPFPKWLVSRFRKVRVRITEIVPKSKKAAKRKGKR